MSGAIITNRPTITCTPSEGLLTDVYSITASGFEPGEQLTISSELVDDLGVTWTAHGLFVADRDGCADLKEAPSEAGTFSGVNPEGLFWSLQPEGGADRTFMIEGKTRNHMLGQPDLDPIKPRKMVLRASGAESGEATTELVQHHLANGVECFDISEGRLRGKAFRQSDRSKSRGAIMSLTGSGGGIEMSYAPALASQGYDVLSLAYFAYEGLPDYLFEIDLEYFEAGFEWMKREFQADKIAVQGASRGGELSVVLAGYLPHYVDGAIAIVPMYAASCGWNHVTGETGPSWTYKGKPIPYAPTLDTKSPEEVKALGDKEPFGFASAPDYYADMNQDFVRETMAVPIENANGPLLMISGVVDQMWPCTWGSDLIVDRLRAKGFQHHYAHLALRETGHWTPLPNTVTTFSQAVYHSLAKMFLACGGTPEGTAQHSRMMWNAMLEHYARIFEDES